MFSKKIKLFQNLAVKLTLYYTSIFIVSTCLLLSGIYWLAEKTLLQMASREALEDAHEIEFAYKHEGLEGLKKIVQMEMNLKGSQNFFVRLFTGQGEVLFETDPSPWGKIPLPAFGELRQVKRIKVSQRTQALQVVFPLEDKFCMVINSLSKEENLLAKLRSLLLWSAFLSVMLSLYGGWFMARRSCSYIHEISHIAREITQNEDFSKRIPLRGTGDDLDQLAGVLNEMLGRIEKLLSELEQVIDNLAHDLRTPLTRIRMLANTALEEKDPGLLQQIQVEIMEECDRLISLLNALLDISEARSGLLKLKREEIKLEELFSELEELFLPVAQSKGIKLEFLSPRISVRADRIRLRQALANLLDNALKYTRPPGEVKVSTSFKGANVIIEVQDTGAGIPAEKIPEIFKKFYRLDESRSSPGRGIGLSLAKAYIEAHGGKIEVESRPGQGSLFRIVLPQEKDLSHASFTRES